PETRGAAGRVGSAVALTGICTVLAAGSARAETSIQPRIGAELTWVDNVNLVTEDRNGSDELVVQARPGIRIEHRTQRSQAYLDYQLQALHFSSGSDSDEVFHQGSLGVQLAALPDWFYIDLGGK